VNVKILLNREELNGRLAIFARFGADAGYQLGDKLAHVASFETDLTDTDSVLALAFEMFNRGAPKFVGDYMYPERSLSVGDVVEIDGTRFACQPVGWKQTLTLCLIDPVGHLAEIREAEEATFEVRPSMLRGAHPVICTDEEMEEILRGDLDPDLRREAFEEMQAEGDMIAREEADLGWADSFNRYAS
jgi:hypothetical protein